jgi:hypothetical protein
MTATSLKEKTEITQSLEPMNSKELDLKMLWISCDILPVVVFYKILETKNLRLLIHPGGDEEKAKTISLKALSEVWVNIIDEYWQKTDEAKYNSNIRKSVNLSKMENEYIGLRAGVALYDIGDPRGMEHIKYFGIKTIEKAKNKVLVLKTKIALKNAELESKRVQDAKYNIYKDYASLIQIIKMPELNNIVVSEWIEYSKLAKQMQKPQQNGRN